MKKLSATCGMLLLAATVLGCADEGDGAWRKNVPAETAAPAESPEGTMLVQGHVSTEGNGNAATGLAGKDILDSATNVTVSKLGENGALTEVGKADVNAGGLFNIPIPASSGAGVLILQVKNVTGAVLGSAVLNGIPAFFKGFAIDATVDTATSFKTQILMTMAKKGVPGVQNYLNVVNTFVDAYLSGGIAVVGAFASDFNSIFGAVAEAVIATENMIVSMLTAAGIPVDVTAITKSQIAAVSGLQGMVTTANGKLVSNAKNLIASLQEATAGAVEPVDKAIFNAVIAGSAMFDSTFKKMLPGQATGGGGQSELSFGVLKSMLKVQSEVARDGIEAVFTQAGSGGDALGLVKQAGEAFSNQIAQATDLKGLLDAKSAYRIALLGKEENPQGSVLEKLATTVISSLQTALRNVNAIVEPLAQNLVSALTNGPLTNAAIKQALANFDGGTKDLASKLSGVTKGTDAQAMAEAIKMASKVFGQ